MVRPKGKTSPEKVCDITCKNCGEHCIGGTARVLGKRPSKHQKQSTSAGWEHQSKANHEIDWEGVKILHQKSVDIKRKPSISEAIVKL